MIRTALIALATLITLVALSIAVLVPSTAALAQDAPPASPFADPACPKLAEVTALLSAQHETYVVIEPESLLSVVVKTKILVSTLGKYVVFGYVDSDGCLTGPTPIAVIPASTGA